MRASLLPCTSNQASTARFYNTFLTASTLKISISVLPQHFLGIVMLRVSIIFRTSISTLTTSIGTLMASIATLTASPGNHSPAVFIVRFRASKCALTSFSYASTFYNLTHENVLVLAFSRAFQELHGL